MLEKPNIHIFGGSVLLSFTNTNDSYSRGNDLPCQILLNHSAIWGYTWEVDGKSLGFCKHRLFGPAVINWSGVEEIYEFHIEGIQVSKSMFFRQIKGKINRSCSKYIKSKYKDAKSGPIRNKGPRSNYY